MLLLSLVLASGVNAADLKFDLHKFTSANAANRQVVITPVDLIVPAGVYPTYDPITFKSDSTGVLLVSNTYGGVYTVCLPPPPGTPLRSD